MEEVQNWTGMTDEGRRSYNAFSVLCAFRRTYTLSHEIEWDNGGGRVPVEGTQIENPLVADIKEERIYMVLKVQNRKGESERGRVRPSRPLVASMRNAGMSRLSGWGGISNGIGG